MDKETREQIDKEIEVFERIGHVEIPVRGISIDEGEWKIVDIQTGETLEVIPTDGVKEITFVLDGDHVIDGDFHVFSLSQRKNIQDLKEMREFMEQAGGKFYESLPAPEKYA